MAFNLESLLREELSISTRYLEVGSGHSTKVSTTFRNIQRIDTIESDSTFAATHIEPLVKERPDVVHLHVVDLNCNGGWGYPGKGVSQEQCSSYPRMIRMLASHQHDLILIDGRYRVACAMYVFLDGRDDVKLIFDDFLNRGHYHVVLQYFYITRISGNTVLMQKKIPNAELRESAKNTILHYETDPR
jgi:hypothetical protein